jgi:hypothetical protein
MPCLWAYEGLILATTIISIISHGCVPLSMFSITKEFGRVHNIGDYLQIILAVWLTAGFRTKIWFTAGSQRRLRFLHVQSVLIFTCETSRNVCLLGYFYK